MEIKEQVKELWKQCFDDTEAFIEFYFRVRYQEKRNMALQKGEELIAAMQLLPYPMTYYGKEVNTDYISGACTHPSYRKQGVMSRLLAKAFKQMWQNKTLFSTLIPANRPLFDYYARHGFVTIFYDTIDKYSISDTPLVINTLQLCQDCDSELIFHYFDHYQRQASCCILHTFEDFQIIAADIQLSGGNIFALKRDEEVCALAFVSPTDKKRWKVKACMANTQEMKQQILRLICERLNIIEIDIHMPCTTVSEKQCQALGMARIIHAEAALQCYAAANPSLNLNLQLTDPQLPENNGFYHIGHGHCIKSAEQSPNDCPALTISELTEKLFSNLQPSMSLMLND